MSRFLSIALAAAALAFALGAEVSPQPADPLPPADLMLTRILIRAADDHGHTSEFDASYRYTRAKKTVTKDGDGDIQKSVVIEFENDPTAGRSADDPNESIPGTKRPYNRKHFTLDRQMLDRFLFTVVARETIGGRPALLMEFRPADKKLPSNDIKDRFLSRTRGRVWVDEEDAAVVRLETQLTSDIKIFGGLVASVSRCDFQFQRARSPEGWWWVENAEWHVEARKFFSRVTVDYEERATGVEKVR